jgi:hypothetical protein
MSRSEFLVINVGLRVRIRLPPAKSRANSGRTSKLRASWGWARLKLPLPFRRLSTKKKGRRDPKREIDGLRRVPAENLGDEEDGEGFRPPAARVQLRYRFPNQPGNRERGGGRRSRYRRYAERARATAPFPLERRWS